MNARQKKVMMILGVASVFLVWRMYVLITEYGLPASSQGEVPPADVAQATPSAGTAALQTDTTPRIDPVEEARKAQLKRERQLEWAERLPFDDVPGLEINLRGMDPAEAVEQLADRPIPPGLRLQGVAQVDGAYVAIVPNQMLRIGDIVGDQTQFKVLRITRSSLTLASGPWRIRYDIGMPEPVIGLEAEKP